jgi:hypothetical protein
MAQPSEDDPGPWGDMMGDMRGLHEHEAGAARVANASLSLTHITPPCFHSCSFPQQQSTKPAAAAAARQQQWQCVRCESVHAILATCLRHCSSLVFSLPVLLALDGAWHIVGEVGGGVLAADVAVAVAWRANSDGQPANNLCVTANCLPFAAVEP